MALNKIDLPGINLERIYTGLSTNELQPSEWGGEIEVVKTSATKGTGIDELLETLLTVAELHEYKANPNRAAVGTCLEAQQDSERGIVAKVLVQNGTLRVGDVVVCGEAYGRVKAMYDTLDDSKRVDEAGPSIPVNITGFDEAPSAGSRFYVLDDIGQAREIAGSRRARALGVAGRSRLPPCHARKLVRSAGSRRRSRKRSTSFCGPTCAVRSKRFRRNC